MLHAQIESTFPQGSHSNLYLFICFYKPTDAPELGKYFKLISLLYSNAPLEWDFVY